MSDFASRLQRVKERIHSSCVKSGRSPETVRLIGASKTKQAGDILEFSKLGLKDFGENYVQEALEKIKVLVKEKDLTWHFIGSLQSNKAKFFPGNFHTIHSLCSESSATKLNQAYEQAGLTLRCLVEVNIDESSTKSGLYPKNLPAFLESLQKFSHLQICGLMCMPDQLPAEKQRKPFSDLRSLMEKINSSNILAHPLTELSMGMSGDFEAAIMEGATMIRLGTLLFGERK